MPYVNFCGYEDLSYVGMKHATILENEKLHSLIWRRWNVKYFIPT